MKLSENFTLAELTVTNRPLANVPTDKEREALRKLAVNVLQPLREAIGKPIVVSSGYRSDAVNRAVGGTATSQHRFGEAADITVPGMSAQELARKIVDLRLPFDQVIQEFGRWVHVSYGPRNRRQVLTAVTRNGKTQYLPGLV